MYPFIYRFGKVRIYRNTASGIRHIIIYLVQTVLRRADIANGHSLAAAVFFINFVYSVIERFHLVLERTEENFESRNQRINIFYTALQHIYLSCLNIIFYDFSQVVSHLGYNFFLLARRPL